VSVIVVDLSGETKLVKRSLWNKMFFEIRRMARRLVGDDFHDVNSSRRELASLKSGVSNPSVNHLEFSGGFPQHEK
jgi:hypothetical protein